jgi:hypothetical protein
MRRLAAALAVSVCIWPVPAVRALDTNGASSAAQAAQAATQPTPAPAAPADPAASSPDAIRHAKRAACRKDAREKKLVGEQKTAYIRDCTAAP